MLRAMSNEKRETLPQDDALWIASHRDSSSIDSKHAFRCQITLLSEPLHATVSLPIRYLSTLSSPMRRVIFYASRYSIKARAYLRLVLNKSRTSATVILP